MDAVSGNWHSLKVSDRMQTSQTSLQAGEEGLTLNVLLILKTNKQINRDK